MHNASRGNLAYTLVDIDSAPNGSLVEAIGRIDGILSVRAITN
jgi:D-3-phosphoglycerate dehydrogenase / 2-oxoglutarate reductase